MITFQYFEGCPNSKATLRNLQEAIRNLGLNDHAIRIVEVSRPESAAAFNFQGSPSILVDGKDIYSERTPVGFSYSCRLYRIGDRWTGVLPAQYLHRQVHKLLNQRPCNG